MAMSDEEKGPKPPRPESTRKIPVATEQSLLLTELKSFLQSEMKSGFAGLEESFRKELDVLKERVDVLESGKPPDKNKNPTAVEIARALQKHANLRAILTATLAAALVWILGYVHVPIRTPPLPTANPASVSS
jgi:hypothetical protein